MRLTAANSGWLRRGADLVEEAQKPLVICRSDGGELDSHAVLGDIANGATRLKRQLTAGELKGEDSSRRTYIAGAEKHASGTDYGSNAGDARSGGVNFYRRGNRDALVTPQRSMSHISKWPALAAFALGATSGAEAVERPRILSLVVAQDIIIAVIGANAKIAGSGRKPSPVKFVHHELVATNDEP